MNVNRQAIPFVSAARTNGAADDLAGAHPGLNGPFFGTGPQLEFVVVRWSDQEVGVVRSPLELRRGPEARPTAPQRLFLRLGYAVTYSATDVDVTVAVLGNTDLDVDVDGDDFFNVIHRFRYGSPACFDESCKSSCKNAS